MTAQSRPYESPVADVVPMPARKTHRVALASAIASTALVLYTACRVIRAIDPGFLIWLLQPWFHGIALDASLSAISVFQPSEFVIGFVTFGATVWLFSYLGAR